MKQIKLKHIVASIVLFSAITVLSCKDNKKSIDKVLLEELGRERDSVSYKLIELLIPLSPTPQEYKTYIKLFKEKDKFTIERLNFEQEKETSYSSDEKKIIQNLINDFTDTTSFKFDKLDLEYRNYFDNAGKKTTRTYTLYFSNIIFNDSMNLACTFLGSYYSDESPGSKIAGYDNLIIFQRKDGEWLIKSDKTLTAY